jgi:hypothetical protein
MQNIEAFQLLRLAIGMNMVLFGTDQSINTSHWLAYLPDSLQKINPFSPILTMRIHALGNLILGAFLLFDLWAPFIFWATLGWWLLILPFAYYRQWTIGLRDTTIIAAIIALLIHRIN